MRRSFLWLVIVLANFSAVSLAAFRVRGLDDDRKPNISFELYRNYLIVVRASAGPLSDLKFLLDTGATPSVISPQLAHKLHLQTMPTGVAVLNGSVPGAIANLSSLQLGPIRKFNFPVLVEDLTFIQKAVPVALDGILGLDVLGQSAFVIDYAFHEIRFGPTPALETSVPLEIKQGRPMVQATVGRQPVELLLDTGSPALVLFQQAHASPPNAASSDASPSTKTIGDFDREQVNMDSFTLGKVRFQHKAALLVPNQRDAGHDFDGLIGPAALGITRVAIDLPAGKLSFTRAR